MSKKTENAVVGYFRDSYEEIQKVTWPTKEQSTRTILLVIAFVIGAGLFTGLFDAIFNYLFQLILDFAQTIKQ